ncbi:sensor histidine kinase [Spongisporangium articulatum]|uniref:histidine kinase n=1 Tax=Spongisporangium articulatum TaxID=3362603 RepID=A0ABW8AKF9_9ACTN
MSDRRAQQLVVDAGLAVVLLGCVLVGGFGLGADTSWLSALLVLPLAARRVWPTGSAVAVFTAGLLQLALGRQLQLADVAVLVALYSVTVYGQRTAHVVAIAGALVGSAASAVLMWRQDSGTVAVTVYVVLTTSSVAAWALGLVRRIRVQQLEALHERAERLERENRQQAAIATATERARIAREMHDVVAHSLSVIIAQADGGRYAGAHDPAAAVRSLSVIAETGRAALADMRAILGVLRTPDSTRDGPPDGERVPQAAPAELAPQPVDADLDALISKTRDAGLAISLVRVGQARALPPGVGLTLYRICQEALTNVLKHAGPGPSVTVMLRWSPGGVDLTVTDDGRGASASSDGAGQGVLGMRERAAMFDGTLTAGPRAGGGFAVHAHLPLPAPRATEEDEAT